MNKYILKTGVQEFIKNNYDTDIVSVLLAKPLFTDISQKELARQLSGKKKAKDKLPTWFDTPGIYYPDPVQLEQTSSERTARYKAGLTAGHRMADLTGGFGVDTFFFSQRIPNTVYCEQDRELYEIVIHNAALLGNSRVEFHCTDGIEFLRNSKQTFDWIYLDPSRRDSSRNKVFLLSDCLPDVGLHLDLLLEKSERVMIKTSPLLDLTAGAEQLKRVSEIHVVAVNNEVKELLWILERNARPWDIKIKTVNLTKTGGQQFGFKWQDEKDATASITTPSRYLYEPNSAILKAGAFKLLCRELKVGKLEEHSHLYTSDDLIPFPGRAFRIDKVMPYGKKELRGLQGTKANVSTRNFPQSVAAIRKKHGLADGGDTYLFFTTINLGKRIVIQCFKV